MQRGAIETPITVLFPRERHRSQYREPQARRRGITWCCDRVRGNQRC